MLLLFFSFIEEVALELFSINSDSECYLTLPPSWVSVSFEMAIIWQIDSKDLLKLPQSTTLHNLADIILHSSNHDINWHSSKMINRYIWWLTSSSRDSRFHGFIIFVNNSIVLCLTFSTYENCKSDSHLFFPCVIDVIRHQNNSAWKILDAFLLQFVIIIFIMFQLFQDH